MSVPICRLSLWQSNRVSAMGGLPRITSMGLPVFQGSKDKVIEIMREFFSLKNPCEGALMESVLYNDCDWREYAFTKTEELETLYGIRVGSMGDRDRIFSPEKASLPVLDKGALKLRITTRWMFGSGQRDLTGDDLRQWGETPEARTAVAFRNAGSLSGWSQYSPNRTQIRRYELIE